MTNPFYTYTSGQPVAISRGSSSIIRAEFTNISAGFDAANTAIDGKGAITGQVWTGTHDFTGGSIVVPTLAAGSSGKYAASVDYVNAVAMSAALPGQTGNAGKTILTNGTSAYWGYVDLIPRSARTANAMLVIGDKSSLVDITSGTFTQTFDTAANLGSGWNVYIRNSGTGQITIPSSDGVTNWIMYPGEVRLFICDGTNFYSVVIVGYKLVTQTSGTWTKPPGYSYHKARAIGSSGGGGGGGGGASGSGSTISNVGGGGGSGGAGGGSGATLDVVIPDSILPSSVPYVVGTGGSGGAGGNGGAGAASGANGQNGSNGSSGSAGTATTFGASGALYYLTAAGGTGGTNGNAGQASGGVGGAAVSNSSATSFSVSSLGVYTLPTLSAGTSVVGGNGGTSGANANPGGNGGAGGTGATSSQTTTASAAGSGGAGSSVANTAGSNGTTPAVPTAAGAGGGGGGGGGGSAGCGTSANGPSAAGGNGAAGAAGAAGQFEIAGII